MDALAFFHEHVGRYLSPVAAPRQVFGSLLPTRTLNGVAKLRIGAKDLLYFASDIESVVVGHIEYDGNEYLTVLDAEKYPGRGRAPIADLILRRAKPPFIAGNIGRANPVSGLTLSVTDTLCFFCEGQTSHKFDLRMARRAQQAFGPYPWPSARRAIQLAAFVYAGDAGDRTVDTLAKLFDQHPGLDAAIADTQLSPQAFEYQLLSWAWSEPRA